MRDKVVGWNVEGKEEIVRGVGIKECVVDKDQIGSKMGAMGRLEGLMDIHVQRNQILVSLCIFNTLWYKNMIFCNAQID